MIYGRFSTLMKVGLILVLFVHSSVSSVVVGQKSLALTIYSNNFGIVKDVRNVYIEEGESDLYFTDVSPNIQTETVTIKPLAESETTKILQQSLVNNQLSWRVWSNQTKVIPCEIVYRATGFAWSVDYTLNINQEETKGDFGAWVMIQNNSRKKYENAKIKLVSGNINTVTNVVNREFNPSIMLMSRMAAPPPPTTQFTQSQLSDFQTYSLNRLINLPQSGKKQFQFIPKIYKVDIKKIHNIDISHASVRQQSPKAKNTIQLINSKKNQLGIPIPAGIIRLYKEDSLDNSVQFIGENRIQHIAPDEILKFETGTANDIVTSKVVKQYTSIDKRGSYDAVVSVSVNNRKKISTQVSVTLTIPFGDNARIKIGQQSQPTKLSSTKYRWTKVLEPRNALLLEWRELYTATT